MTTRRAGWALMTLLSLAVVMVSVHYFALDPSTYFEEQREVFMRRETVLVLHIAGGVLALLTGPLQLARGIRRRWPRFHRVTGRVYVMACLVGGVFGIALSTTALGGLVTTLGFAGLGVAWILTTVLAVVAIRRRDVATHRRWVLRSFALTFAAVTLRLYLGTSIALGLDLETAYRAIAWLCWAPNLALVTWLTRNRSPRRPPAADCERSEATPDAGLA